MLKENLKLFLCILAFSLRLKKKNDMFPSPFSVFYLSSSLFPGPKGQLLPTPSCTPAIQRLFSKQKLKEFPSCLRGIPEHCLPYHTSQVSLQASSAPSNFLFLFCLFLQILFQTQSSTYKLFILCIFLPFCPLKFF